LLGVTRAMLCGIQVATVPEAQYQPEA
jgi:hypothetical protein